MPPKTKKSPAMRAGKKRAGGKRRPTPPVLPQYQPYHYGYNEVPQKKVRSPRKAGKVGKWIPQCLAALVYVASIVLGALIAAGCGTTALGSIYLAELHMNETMDINLRVGYFGGCLSVANLMTDLDDNSTEEEEAQINCIYGLRSTDTEDLGEELWEDLDLSGAAKSSVFEALNTTLPHAVHLQENACFWPPIVIHIATFFLSGLVLGVASTASSNKPSYKFILLVGGLLGAFALGLALTVAIASTSALNALLEGGRSQDESVRNDGAPFVIRRGNLLETFSGVLVAFVTLFYVAIGYLFIRRSK